MSEPVFEACPLIVLAEYLQMIVPTPVATILSVAFDPNTVTGKPLASLTVDRYGSLVTVTVTLVTGTGGFTALHPLTVSFVTDSVAVPGRAGFAVTLLVMVDFVHLR